MNSTLYDPSYRPPLFPRGPGLGLRAFFLCLCAIALIIADRQGEALKPLRGYLGLALAPVIWITALPGRFISASDTLDSRSALERENAELRRKQFILEARLQKMAALEAENQRIRELLASTATLQERVLIAEVIDISQDPYRHQITLNKGARHGVYRGQALLDAHGVMGQVIEVNARSSKALLITDPDHGIPVEINRTGLQTVAVGRGDGSGLRLPFLPSNVDIQVGDLLVSSALGGRFPAGYPIGTVYEVNHVAGEQFMEAYAHPTARLNQGRQALLVWTTEPGDPVAPGGVPLAAGAQTPGNGPAAAPGAAAAATPPAAVAPAPAAAGAPPSGPVAAPSTAGSRPSGPPAAPSPGSPPQAPARP